MSETFQGEPIHDPSKAGWSKKAGTGHASYRWDANGDLKFANFPLVPVQVNGEYRSLYIPIPPELQDHLDPNDPGSAEFQQIKFGTEPGQMTLGPGNYVTINGKPDTKPRFVQVQWSPFKPGWTSDPHPPAPEGVNAWLDVGTMPGKWVASIGPDGHAVFGEPPADPAAPSLPAMLPGTALEVLTKAALAFAASVAASK